VRVKLLAQGENWVVVRKPARVVVHRRPGGREQAMVQVVRNQLGQHVWPVHRLDRGTSGCLLFSLSATGVAPLADALAAGTKRYLAMVRGQFSHGDAIDINAPLRDERGIERAAHTHVACLGASAEPRASLVLATPSTGRFHQVRRHLNRLTHPILGDSSHGDTRVNRWWRETHDLHRLALHCWQLRLVLPEGPLHVSARVPDELWRVWQAQPWWDQAEPRLAALEQEAVCNA
jgi:tRNA pseudouridine65 synthase